MRTCTLLYAIWAGRPKASVPISGCTWPPPHEYIKKVPVFYMKRLNKTNIEIRNIKFKSIAKISFSHLNDFSPGHTSTMSTREKSTCLCRLVCGRASTSLAPIPTPFRFYRCSFRIPNTRKKSIDFGIHLNTAFQLFFRILLDILSRMIRLLNRNPAEPRYIVSLKQCRTRSAGF